jgi:NADPH-dependent ferric siderophore reductase
VRHGWEGVVLKLFRAKDFTFTVTGAEQVTERYRRVHFTDGGLLQTLGVHPTMWVRLWFDNAGKPHQRAYTLVDPDVAAGTFSLEFALHDGCASDWSRKAEPGDTIEATVQGTGFDVPDPLPPRMLVVGDPASLPAINSLLGALDGIPSTVWFEGGDDGLPFPAPSAPGRHELRRVGRGELADRVRAELPGLLTATEHPYVWIACDTRTTRTLASYVRKDLGVPKDRLHALGYWRDE